ncbi:hypothetical protein [Hyphomicrobium sp. DY-1]|uniref:hypothetical protein n=1 Tax=Hyphomicrobium sp. DY-1 TaxID=3075650 RepID=UPI0039C26BBB
MHCAWIHSSWPTLYIDENDKEALVEDNFQLIETSPITKARDFGTQEQAVCCHDKEDGSMSTLSNLIFVAAVVGGPVVLALLYLYGMKTTREKDRIPHSRDITDRATKELYNESEAEREHQEKAAARSDKIVDVIERKTGTSG